MHMTCLWSNLHHVCSKSKGWKKQLILNYERIFKEWWSTIPLISTKRILISHLNSLNTKIPYFVGNPGTILGQAYTYGGVKSINGIPTHLSSVINDRGLKIEILHVELLCFVISSGFFHKGVGGKIFASS